MTERVLTQVVEITTLPLTAVIETRQGYVLERLVDGWHRAGLPQPFVTVYPSWLPARLLRIGEPGRDDAYKLAHSGDEPETSRNAVPTREQRALLKRAVLYMLNYVYPHGATDPQLRAEYVRSRAEHGWPELKDVFSVTRRRSDLTKHDDLVRDSGRRAPGTSGKPVAVWEINPNPRLTDPAEPSKIPPTIKFDAATGDLVGEFPALAGFHVGAKIAAAVLPGVTVEMIDAWYSAWVTDDDPNRLI